MTKPVAIIDLNDNNGVAINRGISDMFDFEEDTSYDDNEIETVDYSRTDDDEDEEDVDKDETTTDDSDNQDEDQDENDEDQDDDTSDDPYKDYTDTALYAKALKDHSDLFADIEVDKTLKPSQFVSTIETKFKEKITSVENDLKDQYKQVADYVELLRGNRTESLNKSLSYRSIAELEITETTPEEVLETVITRTYLDKGIDEPTIKDLIATFKDKGIMDVKAKDCVEYNAIKDREFINSELERIKIEREQEVQNQLDYKENVNKVLETSPLLTESIKDKKAIFKTLFENTEIVEIDRNGKREYLKVPKYNVLMDEFSNNIEKQLLFVQLLLDGFSLDNVKKKAVAEVNNEIINALEDRVSRKTTKKSSKNAWYD